MKGKVKQWIEELVFVLFDLIQVIAQSGKRTACAGGYTEWAKDIGPVTFLYNGDDSLGAVQLQVLGVVLFSSWDEVEGIGYSFGVRWPSNEIPF